MSDADLIRQAREHLDEARASIITPKTRDALLRVEARLDEMENRITRRVLGMGEAPSSGAELPRSPCCNAAVRCGRCGDEFARRTT